LLANSDVNVVFAHWGGGANTNYDHAHANTRLVGLEIAFLVSTMMVSFFTSSKVFKMIIDCDVLWEKDKLGVKASDVHLIGHSLGAHTAGYAGEKIFQLGRITGCTLNY
jgi:pancreatic triacylglycerol lipase